MDTYKYEHVGFNLVIFIFERRKKWRKVEVIDGWSLWKSHVQDPLFAGTKPLCKNVLILANGEGEG